VDSGEERSDSPGEAVSSSFSSAEQPRREGKKDEWEGDKGYKIGMYTYICNVLQRSCTADLCTVKCEWDCSVLMLYWPS
jgi:hypothetical protein